MSSVMEAIPPERSDSPRRRLVRILEPERAWIALGYLSLLLLPLVLLWRPLFAGEALFWGTPLLQFVPWQRLAATMWREGYLPLWNSFLGCGTPLAANYQAGVFYPLYGLALFMPAEVALGWTIALHLALTGFGMVRWARATGMGPLPAFVAGLALEGGGFLVARAGLFPSIAVTFPWIPIWLWRAERLVQTGRLRDALWLGGALGMGLLAGHAQTAFYGGLLLALYFVFRLLQRASSERRRIGPWVFRPLLTMLLALVVGLSLAAVQLLPTAELLRLSQRAEGVDPELALTYSFWPWRMLTLVLPDLFGNPAHGNYWGYGTYWEDALYVGLLPLLLAAEAVAGARRKGGRTGAIWFWILIGGLSLLLALGYNTPIFPWLFDHVPTLDWFRAPARWSALTAIALAALAGIGAQGWRRGRAGWRQGALGVILGLSLVLGGAAAERIVAGLQPTFGPATVRLGGTLLVAGGLVLGRRDKPWWRVAVMGFLLLDLLIFGCGLLPSVDRALYAGNSATGTALAGNPAVERIFWPAEGLPEAGHELKFTRYFRFDDFGPRDLSFWKPMRETLLPNLAMLEGIPSANNYEPLLVGWYAGVAGIADHATAVQRVMGVTHLVTATVDGRVSVTPLDGSLGRAWIVPRARQVARDQMLAALAEPAFDPGMEVLLETTPETTVLPADWTVPSLVVRDGPNRVTVSGILDEPGYLVLADTWYPGWEAAVDGQPAILLRANGAFRAIYLEAGAHVVEMVYRPLSATVGGWLSLAALAGWAGGLWLASRRRGA